MKLSVSIALVALMVVTWARPVAACDPGESSYACSMQCAGHGYDPEVEASQTVSACGITETAASVDALEKLAFKGCFPSHVDDPENTLYTLSCAPCFDDCPSDEGYNGPTLYEPGVFDGVGHPDPWTSVNFDDGSRCQWQVDGSLECRDAPLCEEQDTVCKWECSGIVSWGALSLPTSASKQQFGGCLPTDAFAERAEFDVWLTAEATAAGGVFTGVSWCSKADVFGGGVSTTCTDETPVYDAKRDRCEWVCTGRSKPAFGEYFPHPQVGQVGNPSATVPLWWNGASRCPSGFDYFDGVIGYDNAANLAGVHARTQWARELRSQPAWAQTVYNWPVDDRFTQCHLWTFDETYMNGDRYACNGERWETGHIFGETGHRPPERNGECIMWGLKAGSAAHADDMAHDRWFYDGTEVPAKYECRYVICDRYTPDSLDMQYPPSIPVGWPW